MKRAAILRKPDGKARATVPAPRTKKCRICKEPFIARLPMAVVCSSDCAWHLTVLSKLKAEKAADREKRQKLKTRSEWLKEAQAAFNRWVRARDAALPCISCDRHHEGQYHAGHYLSTGARPELRFDESNVHKQCQPCNTHLHGNLVLYRAALIRRVGLAEVERLEGPHEPTKLSVDELREIKARYTRLEREMAQQSK